MADKKKKLILMSRLSEDTPVIVGSIEVNGKTYPNSVIVAARGRTTVTVDSDFDTKGLPKGIMHKEAN